MSDHPTATATATAPPADRRDSQGSAKKSRSHGAAPVRAGEPNADDDSADELLEALGYKAELVRTRSTWHVAFMSFVLASIPYGLATTLYYPLQGGGPVVVIWGWVLVSLIILCVAASLGEITSVYPTAGGVYYQTFQLAPPSIRRVAAYLCGWAYVVGNITITLAVQFGTTIFFVACVNVFESEAGEPVWKETTYQVFLVFLGVTLLCNAISIYGNRWLHHLDVRCFLPSCPWSCPGMLTAANRADLCSFLDIRRPPRDSHHGPRRCQEWPPRCRLRLWRV
jgi:amino acid permease